MPLFILRQERLTPDLIPLNNRLHTPQKRLPRKHESRPFFAASYIQYS